MMPRKTLCLTATIAILSWGNSLALAAGHHGGHGGHIGGFHGGGGHFHGGFRGGAFYYGGPYFYDYGYGYDDCVPVRYRRCWRDSDGDRHCGIVTRYNCS